MRRLDTSRLKHLWNKLRNIPIEWDLAPYEQHLSEIATINLGDASDDELRSKSAALIKRATEGEPVEDLLIETYALVRETAKRSIRFAAL